MTKSSRDISQHRELISIDWGIMRGWLAEDDEARIISTDKQKQTFTSAPLTSQFDMRVLLTGKNFKHKKVYKTMRIKI